MSIHGILMISAGAILVIGGIAVDREHRQQQALTQFQNLAWSGFLPDSDTSICSIDNGKHWWRGRGPVCYAEDNPDK